METERQKTDEAIRETALQREAIEKSLNAMERENRELYRNCSQLQQQITQLEIENGNRIMDITNKQREEQEKQVERVRNEKAQVSSLSKNAPKIKLIQIEKLIEHRERVFKQKLKQLESQLQTYREQLDAERRRTREFRDRQTTGELLRGGYLNRGGISSFGSGGSAGYLINTDNIDSAGFR